MKSHLQVKVFTLSAEMTYIRKQENRWKNRARIARQRQQILSDPVEKDNSKDRQLYAESNFWSQREHRVHLKWDARTNHLAYGCMRGVPYSKMEELCYGHQRDESGNPHKGYASGKCTSEPNWNKIESTVQRFSEDEPSPQDYMQRFSEWLTEAKLWYKGNPARIEMWVAVKATLREALLAAPDYQAELAKRRRQLEELGRSISGHHSRRNP
jgi:hypothetical protein